MKLVLKEGAAVVTGAASGIGRGIALALAARGCGLALIDRNEAGLLAAAEAARSYGVRVSTYALDLTDANAVAGLPQRVLADHAFVTVLVNNAGAALVGKFDDITIDEFRWLMETNFWSVVTLTKLFLPHLLTRPAAQIVNISSLFGLIAPPHQAPYVASKFAVRGFSESLRHELQHTNVGVTVVHPGGIKTGITKNARIAAALDHTDAARNLARFDALLRMAPERAGEIIVRGIEQRARRIVIGSDARVLDVLQRIFPASYWRLLSLLSARATPR